MTIIEKLEKVLEEKKSTKPEDVEQTSKGMEFIKKMEQMGALSPNKESLISPNEDGRDKLSLFANTSIL